MPLCCPESIEVPLFDLRDRNFPVIPRSKYSGSLNISFSEKINNIPRKKVFFTQWSQSIVDSDVYDALRCDVSHNPFHRKHIGSIDCERTAVYPNNHSIRSWIRVLKGYPHVKYCPNQHQWSSEHKNDDSFAPTALVFKDLT